MASSGMFMIIAIVAVFVPSVLTTEHVVGDKTVFKYTPGAHSVLRVNGTGFQECKAANDIVPLTTGNDVIPLSSPGNKWYICGVAKHCESGNQKLSITVLPQLGSPETSPSSSPTRTTSSGAAGNIASRYYGLIVAIAGIFGMIMF